MKKLTCLMVALGLLCIGLLTGCNQQSSTPPATPPATNAPAH
ncbi:MAG TPA: hypothetical protein VMO20_05280 [Candidatus Acidoferrum sp.]|nr:hypothetical protein [Candidatus Acidoferrum sp.]